MSLGDAVANEPGPLHESSGSIAAFELSALSEAMTHSAFDSNSLSMGSSFGDQYDDPSFTSNSTEVVGACLKDITDCTHQRIHHPISGSTVPPALFIKTVRRTQIQPSIIPRSDRIHHQTVAPRNFTYRMCIRPWAHFCNRISFQSVALTPLPPHLFQRLPFRILHLHLHPSLPRNVARICPAHLFKHLLTYCSVCWMGNDVMGSRKEILGKKDEAQ